MKTKNNSLSIIHKNCLTINLKEISNQLRQLRILNGFTQKDIANNLHKTTTYVSNIENGKTKLNLQTLIIYAHTCNFSIDALIGLTPNSGWNLSTDISDYILFNKIINLSQDKKQKLSKIIDIIK